jgi:Lon protease-like protein
VWREADGLNMGDVAWLAPEPELALPAEFAQLGDTVRRALAELPEQYRHTPKRFDDAAWVGARLSELLPIDLNDKQLLLELEDPIARLDALLSLAPRES